VPNQLRRLVASTTVLLRAGRELLPCAGTKLLRRSGGFGLHGPGRSGDDPVAADRAAGIAPDSASAGDEQAESSTASAAGSVNFEVAVRSGEAAGDTSAAARGHSAAGNAESRRATTRDPTAGNAEHGRSSTRGTTAASDSKGCNPAGASTGRAEGRDATPASAGDTEDDHAATSFGRAH
jgi:hypothetical protein